MTITDTISGLLLDGPGRPGELAVTTVPRPAPAAGEVLVRMQAAAINPSDVLNVLGLPITTYPRVPGRDFAGVVVDGPDELVGSAVWGTGSGDLGFTRHGTHAELLSVPRAAVVARPTCFSAVEAGASGLAYATASAGLQKAGLRAGTDVLVTGGAGGVGTAAAAIARWRGARVIAAVKDAAERAAAERLLPGVDVVETGDPLAAQVHELTGGRGVDLAFDTVGTALFAEALAALADDGALVVISAKPGVEVGVDLSAFYRRRLSLLGVSSTRADAAWCASLLAELRAGFEEGALPPVPVARELPFAQAADGYQLVAGGQAGGRVVLTFPTDPEAP